MVKEIKEAFNEKLLSNIYIHQHIIEEDVQCILNKNVVSTKNNIAAWLLKVVSVIDLTTLSGDDTRSNVRRLCMQAARPLNEALCKKLDISQNKITTAAVCVYPNRVEDAYYFLKNMDMINTINIAAVATGFPSGLYPLNSRLEEIKFATSQGANEIDVVLDRSLVLTGQWARLYDEVSQMREACTNAHLKVILGVGELGTLENVYKASIVSMMAGADFIKTSTGKEAVNATLPVGLVMCRAIKNYFGMTGRKVGLKPAGGIKTYNDAVNWLLLVQNELGNEWLEPHLFRIGASSLLTGIEKALAERFKPE